jgi:tetratricopeptide (TPR) repeat protein
MMNLGNVQHLGGDAEQAAATYAEAAEMVQPKLGEGHPITSQLLANSCGALMTSGRTEAARDHCERAVALQEQLLGPEHRDLAPVLANLANLMLRTDELERAEDLAARAVALFELRTAPGSTERIGALLTLAEARCRLDRAVQARPLLADAESLADTSLFRAHVAAMRGLCASREGDLAGSVAGYEAAMAHLEQVDASHPLMAQFLEGIAFAETRRGRDDAAAAALERALAVSAPQRRTAAGADLVFALAQTLARTGDLDRARRLATEARATLEAAGQTEDAAFITDWLAVL